MSSEAGCIGMSCFASVATASSLTVLMPDDSPVLSFGRSGGRNLRCSCVRHRRFPPATMPAARYAQPACHCFPGVAAELQLVTRRSPTSFLPNLAPLTRAQVLGLFGEPDHKM
jgi:hypothetical protein